MKASWIIVTWSILLVLVLFLWLIPETDDGGNITGPRVPVLPADWDPGSITGIRIEYPEDRTFVLERSENGWMQVEPFSHPVEGYIIRQLLIDALGLMAHDSFEPGALPSNRSLESLSLDPARVTIHMATQDGQERELHLGRRSLAGRAWLQNDADQRVIVADSKLHQRLLGQDPIQWRSRSLVQVPADLDTIIFTIGDRSSRLQREGTSWRMTEPVTTRADSEAIDRLLMAMGRAGNTAFMMDQPDELGIYGLDPPQASLVLSGPGGRHEVRLGNPIELDSQDRYGMVAGVPTIVRVDQATQSTLFPPEYGLLDPTGSAARPEDVRWVEVRLPDGTFSLRRNLDGFLGGHGIDAEDDSLVPVAPELVDQLLQQLTTSRAQQVSVQEYPSRFKVATIILHGFNGRPVDAINVVEDPSTGNIGLDNGDGVLRIFPARMAPALDPVEYGLEPMPTLPFAEDQSP